MVPRKQAGHMTCTRPQAERQILLAMRASSTHDPFETLNPITNYGSLETDHTRRTLTAKIVDKTLNEVRVQRFGGAIDTNMGLSGLALPQVPKRRIFAGKGSRSERRQAPTASSLRV